MWTKRKNMKCLPKTRQVSSSLVDITWSISWNPLRTGVMTDRFCIGWRQCKRPVLPTAGLVFRAGAQNSIETVADFLYISIHGKTAFISTVYSYELMSLTIVRYVHMGQDGYRKLWVMLRCVSRAWGILQGRTVWPFLKGLKLLLLNICLWGNFSPALSLSHR